MIARFVLHWICLLLVSSVAHGQSGDPWLDSLDDAKGTIVGDMEPRFAPADQTSGQDQQGNGSGAVTGAGAINPADPETAGHIRTWIETAEPPPNATRGARFRYTYRGNMVGTTADGGIITSPHETGVFDAVFLWTNRRMLDSVNHCTMEEYVLANTAGDSIGHCRSRYTNSPVELADFTGRAASEIRQELIPRQIAVEIKPGDPAPGSELEDTVYAQVPGPGTKLRPGQSVTLTVYGDHAIGSKEHGKIDQAIADCQFDEANRLIMAIDSERTRLSFSRRYEEAFNREEKSKALFAQANDSFLSCDYENAQNNLAEANANTRCERYRARISQSLKKVQAAAEREAGTKALFSEADQWFKKGEFDNAKAKLTEARANTRCERYISKIDAAIAKVAKSGREKDVASQDKTPSPADQASKSDSTSSNTGTSYFVGVWALSQSACKGELPPQQNSSGSNGGSNTLGGAISEAIGEALEQIFATMGFQFNQDGTYSLVNIPTGETTTGSAPVPAGFR